MAGAVVGFPSRVRSKKASSSVALRVASSSRVMAWAAAVWPIAAASGSAPTDRSRSVSSRYGWPLTRTEPEPGA